MDPISVTIEDPVEHSVQTEVESLLAQSDAVAALLYPGAYRRPITAASLAKPDTYVLIARQAEEYARAASSDVLFNHLMRCYAFAELFAQQENAKADRELIFLSTTLHDLGFTDVGRGPNRFEIEGAHAARRFLKGHGVADERSWQVWSNIALHTGDLNLFKEDEARLTQLGILYDVIALPEAKLDPADVAEVVRRYPRLGFKRAFYDMHRDELDAKKPYPHRFHVCTMIEHQRGGSIDIPDAAVLLNSAPFDD